MSKYDFQQKRKFITSIGHLCGDFRKRRLRITLREMEHRTGIPTTTLNSFEQGRSSSLNVFYIYLVSCETLDQATEFLQYMVEVCLFNWGDNNGKTW